MLLCPRSGILSPPSMPRELPIFAHPAPLWSMPLEPHTMPQRLFSPDTLITIGLDGAVGLLHFTSVICLHICHFWWTIRPWEAGASCFSLSIPIMASASDTWWTFTYHVLITAVPRWTWLFSSFQRGNYILGPKIRMFAQAYLFPKFMSFPLCHAISQ